MPVGSKDRLYDAVVDDVTTFEGRITLGMYLDTPGTLYNVWAIKFQNKAVYLCHVVHCYHPSGTCNTCLHVFRSVGRSADGHVLVSICGPSVV